MTSERDYRSSKMADEEGGTCHKWDISYINELEVIINRSKSNPEKTENLPKPDTLYSPTFTVSPPKLTGYSITIPVDMT